MKYKEKKRNNILLRCYNTREQYIRYVIIMIHGENSDEISKNLAGYKFG